MSAATESQQAPTNRARLRGEALRKWYAQSGNLSPEQWEAEQKRLEDERRGPAGTFVIVCFVLLVIMVFTGPLAIALLSVWLVIGSGNFWGRVATTMAAIFVLGIWNSYFLALLLMVLFLSTSMSYMLTLVFPRLVLMPTRPVQFSLWEMGGCTIIMAVSLSLLRATGFNLEHAIANPHYSFLFFFISMSVSINVVLLSMPVIIPRRYRSGSLFRGSAVLVLIVTPFIEMLLLNNSSLGHHLNHEEKTIAMVAHGAGVLVTWFLLYVMEFAQAFCEVKPPTYDRLDVESDPLGTSTTA